MGTSLKKHLIALVEELRRTHSEQFYWEKNHSFPNFVTAENLGYTILFTDDAIRHLHAVARCIFDNRSDKGSRIELKSFTNVIRQVVANMFAADEFDDESLEGYDRRAIKRLKSLAEELISKESEPFTHYLPAWSLAEHFDKPLKLGSVQLFSRDNWIDCVDFPQKAKDTYLGELESNNQWKVILRDALDNKTAHDKISGLASDIYSVVKDCPSLVKVTIEGFEKDFSGKLAKIAAKSALDSISLILGDRSFFLQQALQDERLEPIVTHSLIETNGFLWLPGSGVSDRFAFRSQERIIEYFDDQKHLIPYVTSVLDGLLAPAKHPHPKLSMRWATALDWFAEGAREVNDAVAITKIATSLDVLSCAGKFQGILSMVSKLLQIEENSVVIRGEKPQKLYQLIKRIYDDGRSKILHGTYCDRLQSFSALRGYAFSVTRLTLLTSLECLYQYEGADDDDAFRNMSPELINRAQK